MIRVWYRESSTSNWQSGINAWGSVLEMLRLGWDVQTYEPPKCEQPGCFKLATRYWPAMTAYADECGKEHINYWNDMWAEYRNSQGF